eukprot:CAMPEP_0119563192 /NCGR_PEP_ID=MMETSP1352-20130426/22670_1 /TAXON_ID=265584 /ORGANISM="Stauroneis constricta, Strain CCMP1120" /LENGTH=187 /DNA_ID=CAMNT_0007611739 /DNA_START=135 /DNA_END=695 /DNA_ORIENTATION=+
MSPIIAIRGNTNTSTNHGVVSPKHSTRNTDHRRNHNEKDEELRRKTETAQLNHQRTNQASPTQYHRHHIHGAPATTTKQGIPTATKTNSDTMVTTTAQQRRQSLLRSVSSLTCSEKSYDDDDQNDDNNNIILMEHYDDDHNEKASLHITSSKQHHTNNNKPIAYITSSGSIVTNEFIQLAIMTKQEW